MPYYDLRCVQCDREFNISATITEKTEKQISCPDCGSHELETVFKGTPAYIKSRSSGDCPHRSACGSMCPHGI